MRTLIDILKSRTVWTIALMFVMGGLEGVREFIPSEIQPHVFGVLALLAAYFRVAPRQNYNE